MGNSSGMVVFWLGVSLFSMLIVLGITAVDPCNPDYPSNNNIFFVNNIVAKNLVFTDSSTNTYFCADGVTVAYTTSDKRYFTFNFENNKSSEVDTSIGRGTTGNIGGGTGSTPSFIYPDWLYTSFKWITTPLSVGSTIVNLIGAPYIVCVTFFGNSAVSSLLGAVFSILNLWILVNWIRGGDN